MKLSEFYIYALRIDLHVHVHVYECTCIHYFVIIYMYMYILNFQSLNIHVSPCVLNLVHYNCSWWSSDFWVKFVRNLLRNNKQIEKRDIFDFFWFNKLFVPLQARLPMTWTLSYRTGKRGWTSPRSYWHFLIHTHPLI